MHRLATKHLVVVAQPEKQIDREGRIHRLGFLKAEDVRGLFGQEPFDDANARTDRIDIPRSNFHGVDLAAIHPARKRPRYTKAPAPGAWSEGRPAFVTQACRGDKSGQQGGKSRHRQPRLHLFNILPKLS